MSNAKLIIDVTVHIAEMAAPLLPLTAVTVAAILITQRLLR